MKPQLSGNIFSPAFLMILLSFSLNNVYASESANPLEKINQQNIDLEQVDSVLAVQTDEQVRSLLKAELERDRLTVEGEQKKGGTLFGIVKNWLHFFDVKNGQRIKERFRQVLTHSNKLPR